MRNKIFLVLLCAGMLFSCKSAIVNESSESGTVSPIYIRSPSFFWMLRPWKKGTLVTMDGKARFAELSFVGRSRIRIRPLVNFPLERIDRRLVVAPEAGVCITQSSYKFHVADISSGKTKSFAPLRTWRFSEGTPSIFDSVNGLICFGYYSQDHSNRMSSYNIIYDPKNDRILYESPERGELISFIFSFTSELTLTVRYNDDMRDFFFYNWWTQELTRNELTEKITSLGLMFDLRPGRNINPVERFLFADIGKLGEQKNVKLTWDENYEDVTVIPMDYLIPEGKRLNDITLSADGKWATTFVSGYYGLYGEMLVKRAFFHLDGRYPNGISMPVFADDYDVNRAEQGSFVEHPVHGWCFAEEKRREDNGSEKLYLRLYKMSDVLEEINRQLLTKAK